MGDLSTIISTISIITVTQLGFNWSKNKKAELINFNAILACLVFLGTIFFLFQGLENNCKTQTCDFIGNLNAVRFSTMQQAILLSGLITGIIFVSILATKPMHISGTAVASLVMLGFVACAFLFTDSLFIFLATFELLLLTSLYLLRLTSKSERVMEATVEMFFWTLIGSLTLLTAFIWISLSGVFTFSSLTKNMLPSNFLMVLILVGFGVKIPVWPFYSWLLKAHVEASVEFSILLSGFIVKLGVFGLAKMLSLTFNVYGPILLFSMSLMGLISATIRLFAQRDLKRVVALTTVIEMNWLGLCLAMGGGIFDALVAYIIVVHSITTALEFFLVEVLSKRYGVRDAMVISSLFLKTPLIAVVSFFVILITIGFPGTPLFLAKILFLSELSTASWALTFLIGGLLILILPLFFIKLWAPIWFGLSKLETQNNFDLTGTELTIFSGLLFIALVLSFWPTLLLSF